MSAAPWHTLLQDGGTVDLSSLVKLRVSGPDALRYLNGQISNDLRRLQPGHSLPACLCTHKGKLEALVMISRDGEDYLVTADSALRDFLPLRLEKYLIADDAVITDVSADFDILHCFGGTASAGTVPDGARPFEASRLGQPGVDLWLPPGTAATRTLTPPQCIEALRIARGIPAWEPELSGGILPPEARLDETAIDYHKGCYTGQEVISRLRSVGQVNRRLECLAAPDAAEAPAAGDSLFAIGPEDQLQPAGTITSATRHPATGAWLGLGYVKRQSAALPLVAARSPDGPLITVKIRKTLDDGEPQPSSDL